MMRITLGTLCVALTIGGLIPLNLLHAADAPPSTKEMLAAKDFWDTTGADFKHDFGPATAAEIQRIAADPTATPSLRLRATKLACDLADHSRSNDTFGAGDSRHAVAVAMKHLEANLADGTVRKFSPELGITHLTVSQKGDDADGIWVLVESVDPARSGGLNVRVDPRTWAVTSVEQWGKVNPAAAQK